MSESQSSPWTSGRSSFSTRRGLVLPWHQAGSPVRTRSTSATGRPTWRRFTVHYTPKHGSWLNPAEIEVGLWSRECLGRVRVAAFEELRSRTSAWNASGNRNRRRINWQFTTADARRVSRYEQGVMHGTEH